MIKYDKQVIKAFKKSEEEMYYSQDKEVNVHHFILSTLKFDNNINKIFRKYNITYEKYKKHLNYPNDNTNNKNICYSPSFKRIIDLSYDVANKYGNSEITLEHIYITIINEDIDLNILKDMNLNIEVFYKDILKLITSKDMTILELGTDLTLLAKNNKLNRAIGRESEINNIIEVLARKNKNNPILIGEAGVGKTAIVEELANMIINNTVPEFLKNQKIISLNIASIISGTKYRGEFEEKLTKILKECETKENIILFIDEIHTIVGAGGAEGAIDAANILKPILARGTLKIIGATTINEYKKYIITDKALDRRFQKVLINIPSHEETYYILKKIKKEYENFHNVNISDKLIKRIVELSDKYIFDRNNPDKSIDILDEACAMTSILSGNDIKEKLYKKIKDASLKKEEALKENKYKEALYYKELEKKISDDIKKLYTKKSVSLHTIIKVIESKCNSNILDNENMKIYSKIKEELNNKVIGQKESIEKIVNRLKILKDKRDNLPISILIKGPSGSGKTLLVNTLSKVMKRNLIKLNMSDFTSEISINKIVGSPQGYIGYDDNNTVFEELKLNPNSIILLDEIEKANYTVINLFSKILEDGFLKTSKNEIINFKNTIFIITSNEKSYKNMGYINTTHTDDNISKEFLNKINLITELNKLTKEDIKRIIEIKLQETNYNYNVDIKLNNKQIEEIISKSLYEIEGANNISKILTNHIENILVSHSTL